MPKFVTYHACKSTNPGGVESLIRELQALAFKNDFECIEVYRKNELEEVYDEKNYVQYARIHQSSTSKVHTICGSRSKLAKIGLCNDDYIFIFNPIYLIYLPMSVLLGSKIVLVQSSRLDMVYSRWVVRRLLDFFGRFLFRLTFYGENDLEQFSSMFPSLKTKARVIPRGCRLKTASSPKIMSRSLVAIARIDESVKNFEMMIRVMKELGADYTLDIYGAGSDPEITNLVNLVSSTDNVKFLGPTSDVAGVLKEYSIFLMTSRYEGLGQSVLEARSQGLPSIVFNTFPNAELVVKDGETGFLVEPWLVADYVRSIKYLLSDPAVYRQFSERSIEYAQEMSLDRVNGLWEAEVLYASR